MPIQLGRTVSKFVKFYMSDSAGTIREIPVDSIGPVGLSYGEVDLSAFQDAVKGFLPDQPDFSLEISGPFDTAAAVAASGSASAPSLSGSHTILAPLPGLMTPLSWAVCFGMRQYYFTGEPAFGQTKTAASGVLVFEYMPDPNAGKYSAKLRLFPGSVAPTWTNAIPT
jgi:hypothetical protein